MTTQLHHKLEMRCQALFHAHESRVCVITGQRCLLSNKLACYIWEKHIKPQRAERYHEVEVVYDEVRRHD